jgi:NitT/TauT family transport system substrate-binding protein
MSKKLILVILLLVLGVLGVQAQEMVDLTLFMTFIPNIQFAPVYAALENGYFTENGINVTIEHGFDEALGVERIAANELQFGIISGEQIILARAQERPVVYVYQWFQQYPVGIVVTNESGIESVNDLVGRRVGIPALSGASYIGLTAMLSANNMVLDDIQIEVIGFNAPEIVCTGGVDAAVVYANNEPLQIQLRAETGDCGTVSGVTIFPTPEGLVSNGIITNEETIANNPDLVRAVVAAFDSGLRDVINNPAEAFLFSARSVEGLLTDEMADFTAALETAAAAQAEFLTGQPDREAIAESRVAMRAALGEQFDNALLLQFDVLLASIEMWDSEALGYTEMAEWEAMQQTLLTMIDPATSMPVLAEAIALDGVFSNEFLPVREG